MGSKQYVLIMNTQLHSGSRERVCKLVKDMISLYGLSSVGGMIIHSTYSMYNNKRLLEFVYMDYEDIDPAYDMNIYSELSNVTWTLHPD